ncbi:hypothetical protein ACJX0J_038554, partial [Zea mays]
NLPVAAVGATLKLTTLHTLIMTLMYASTTVLAIMLDNEYKLKRLVENGTQQMISVVCFLMQFTDWNIEFPGYYFWCSFPSKAVKRLICLHEIQQVIYDTLWTLFLFKKKKNNIVLIDVTAFSFEEFEGPSPTIFSTPYLHTQTHTLDCILYSYLYRAGV